MKIVKLTLILFFSLISKIISAQDIIILKTGDEIESKVIEIGESLVKYRKHANLDGPLYTLEKVKIFMIKYENGEKDVFETFTENQEVTSNDTLTIVTEFFGYSYYAGYKEISKRDFLNTLRSDEEAYEVFENGKSLIVAGNIIGIPCGAVFGFSVGTMLGGGTLENNTTLIVSGVGTVLSVIMTSVGNTKKRKATEIYNKSKSQVSLGFSQTGFGVLLNF